MKQEGMDVSRSFTSTHEVPVLQVKFSRSRFIAVAALASALGITLTAATRPVTATLSNFILAQGAVVAGAGTSGTATIAPTSAAVEVLSFTSSNPAVAFVAKGMAIQPGGSQATVPVISISAGCTVITANLRAQSFGRTLRVHPVSNASPFVMSELTEYQFAGYPYQMTIKGGNPLATARFTLRSSNTQVATVPASVETVRGTAVFTVTPRSPGCTTITATMGTQSLGRTSQVINLEG
jgi:hypothetical protein